jgi:FMN reductase
MSRIAVLSGSPTPDSRTLSFAAAVGERLEAEELDVRLIDLRALPAADVLHCTAESTAVRAALDTVARANGIVVATPVHHAAYSGILKAFLDLLPRSAFAGKVALPLAVGGSPAHVLTIDYALRPVLVSMGAHVTRGHFLLCTEMERAADGSTLLQWEAQRRLDAVVREFVRALRVHGSGEAGAPAEHDHGQVVVARP